MVQKQENTTKKKRNKRRKIETTLVGILSVIFTAGCAGIAGYMIGTISKKYLDSGFGAFLICMGALVLLGLFAFKVQMYLHELGHLLFGKLTGYQFQSIRFGSLMLIKLDGKLKVKRLKVAGTGGQCLLLPPDTQGYDYPTGLYNWGGCIVNFMIAVFCLIGLLLLKDKVSIPGLLLLVFGISGFVTALLNGIPLASLSNDGYNAGLLRKNERARKAFKTQLLINNGLTNGEHIKDMPKEWFAFDLENEALDNTLTVSAAIMKFSYLMDTQNFTEAETFGEYILNHAEGMIEVHELMIKAELLFCDMILHNHPDRVKEVYNENKKKFECLNSLPTMSRILYGYYRLADPDEEKAQKQLSLFEKLSKNYPYPTEIEAERELIRRIDERAIQQNEESVMHGNG